MKLTLEGNNFKNLEAVAQFLKKHPAGDVFLVCGTKRDELFQFAQAMPDILSFLDSEANFGVWLENFPYCVVPKMARDHVRQGRIKIGEKNKKCETCIYNEKCKGFPAGYFEKFSDSELAAVPDVPDEVKIEVESRCNFDCIFCFNKASFASKKRGITVLDTAYVKNIIDQAAKMGVKVVRFTGGEPLLRKDIFSLFAYAKKKGLYVKLNTNGSLVTSAVAQKMRGKVDNVLISLESYNDALEEEITRHTGSFSKKIRAVKLLKKAGISRVRISTVALSENIVDFDKLAKTALELPFDEWEWYRPISMGNKKIIFTKRELQILVEKIVKLRKKTQRLITFGNDVPYCGIENSQTLSWLAVGSQSNLIIDPRGFIKSEYYTDENLGKADDLEKAWRSVEMMKKRDVNFLPAKCLKCKYVSKCAGGSRYEAQRAFGRTNAKDPLAK